MKRGLKVKTAVKATGLGVSNHSLVTLPRCANRTKAGDACGSCHYCRVHRDGPEYWAR